MVTGSCLCGRVRYEIVGAVKRTSHCHCTMCQKQHGAAFASYANVASEAFSYTSGRESVARYQSSPEVTRCFCQHCGSNLTWQMAQIDERIAVTLGTFDTPFEGVVTTELHLEDRASWLSHSHKES